MAVTTRLQANREANVRKSLRRAARRRQFGLGLKSIKIAPLADELRVVEVERMECDLSPIQEESMEDLLEPVEVEPIDYAWSPVKEEPTVCGSKPIKVEPMEDDFHSSSGSFESSSSSFGPSLKQESTEDDSDSLSNSSGSNSSSFPFRLDSVDRVLLKPYYPPQASPPAFPSRRRALIVLQDRLELANLTLAQQAQEKQEAEALQQHLRELRSSRSYCNAHLYNDDGSINPHMKAALFVLKSKIVVAEGQYHIKMIPIRQHEEWNGREGKEIREMLAMRRKSVREGHVMPKL